MRRGAFLLLTGALALVPCVARPAPTPQPYRGLEAPLPLSAAAETDWLGQALTPLRLPLLDLSAGLEAGVTWYQRDHVQERLERLLYNDAKTAGVLPAASYDSESGLRGGAVVFHNSLLGGKEWLGLQGLWGGQHNYEIKTAFKDRRVAGQKAYLEARYQFDADPVLHFYGIGLDQEEADRPGLAGPRQEFKETTYGQERHCAYVSTGYGTGEGEVDWLRVGASAIFNQRQFWPGRAPSDDQSIDKVYDTTRIPGFVGTRRDLELTADLDLDSRDREGFPSRGVKFSGFWGVAPRRQFVGWRHWGFALSRYRDLYMGNRVLVINAAAEAVEPVGMEVPFYALPNLDNAQRLRGWGKGQFRDRIMVLTGLEYRWPVHKNVQGHLFYDLGTVAPDWAGVGRHAPMSSVGVGLAAADENSVFTRISLTYGEGFHLVLTFNQPEVFNRRRQL